MNAATLFCCEASEISCGLRNVPWLSISDESRSIKLKLSFFGWTRPLTVSVKNSKPVWVKSVVVTFLHRRSFTVWFTRTRRSASRIADLCVTYSEHWSGSFIAHCAKTRQINLSAICKDKLKEHGLIKETKEKEGAIEEWLSEQQNLSGCLSTGEVSRCRRC